MTDTPLNHIAFIMDGNGRWAKARGLSRSDGHKQGAKNLKKVLEACKARDIHYMTLYAFSTENWKRPEAEVHLLMTLFRQYLSEAIKEFKPENDVCFRFIGDRSRFTPDIQERMAKLESLCSGKENYHLTVCLSYSGRDEMKRAIQKMMQDAIDGKLKPAEVSEQTISDYLDTAGLPDPDLMIRTSGEQRLSNFLLWQLAYSEFYFPMVHWPEFSEKDLDEAIEAYNTRDRRFGKVK